MALTESEIAALYGINAGALRDPGMPPPGSGTGNGMAPGAAPPPGSGTGNGLTPADVQLMNAYNNMASAPAQSAQQQPQMAAPASLPARQPIAGLYDPVSVGQAAPAQLPRQWQASGLPSYADRINQMTDKYSSYNMSQFNPGDITDEGHLVTTSGSQGASVSSTGTEGGGPPQSTEPSMIGGKTKVPHWMSATGWVDADGNPTSAPEGYTPEPTSEAPPPASQDEIDDAMSAYYAFLRR